jgi:UDP-N-acetylglucosamine 2-epimerase (non-hydrolysing)
MKIITVLGTRPEIIRLSRLIPLLDKQAEHILVHTGQNFDDRLSGVFFRDLDIRKPDFTLDVSGSFGEQVGMLFARIEKVFLELRPDRLLLLGDTNSALVALVARRLGMPVFHMEAGNRCYDDRVPEEVNRRVIDHSSTILMPYTNRSRENLLREGIDGSRIYVIGNPIKQVMDHFSSLIEASTILSDLNLAPGKYFLVTAHRAENVDIEFRLRGLLEAFSHLSRIYSLPVVCSFHPRTRARAEAFGLNLVDTNTRFLDPLGFPDFVRLEKNAFCVLSDSGTVQEETCILGVPNVTIREVTERPETLECGSNLLAGCQSDVIHKAVRFVTECHKPWIPPSEYLASDVAEIVCRIVTGVQIGDAAEREWQQGNRIWNRS